MRAFVVGLATLLVLATSAATAHAATCGDGTIETPEQCDDGGVASGDGCSATCTVECPSLDGSWLAETTAPGGQEDTWLIDEGEGGVLAIQSSFESMTGTRTPLGGLSEIFIDPETSPFLLSGSMSTCDQIDLTIDLLPWLITLTRQVVEPPGCDDALALTRTKIDLSGLTSPAGEQSLVATGRITLPPGYVYHPEQTGMQILLEDLGSGDASVFDVTHETRPVPSYPGETCFARGEGWRRESYKSIFKPGDPAECRLGDADVFTLRLADLRRRGPEIGFTLRVRKASIAAPVGPVRLTLAFGTTAEALEAARCGDPQPVLSCVRSANQKRMQCR